MSAATSSSITGDPTMGSPTASGATTSSPATSGPATSGPTTSGPTTSGPTSSGPTPSDATPGDGDARAQGTLVWDLAHTRSGDKGNTSNIAVMAYDEAGWQRIRRELTTERVMAAYAHLAEGPVMRYELPKLRALNFVIEKALAGGVTRSLRLDPHGKTLSSVMLTIRLPDAE